MIVRIEHEVSASRKLRRLAGWDLLFTATLLYADARIMLFRGCGSHQSANDAGEFDHFGMLTTHVTYQRLERELGHDRWGRVPIGRKRIAPASLEMIRRTLAKRRCGRSAFITRDSAPVFP